MVGSEDARAGLGSTSSGKGPRIKGSWRLGGAVLGVLLALATAAAAPRAAETERSTPSGLPVPRYVSLKFDEVNARSGPGDDHRLLWTYHVRGLPVQVVAETAEWRRICDPQLGLAWVHRRTTDGRRMVLQSAVQPLPIRASPKPAGRVRAYMAPRALGALDHCRQGWCKIRVGGIEGWAPAAALWGAADAPQCR